MNRNLSPDQNLLTGPTIICSFIFYCRYDRINDGVLSRIRRKARIRDCVVGIVSIFNSAIYGFLSQTLDRDPNRSSSPNIAMPPNSSATDDGSRVTVASLVRESTLSISLGIPELVLCFST